MDTELRNAYDKLISEAKSGRRKWEPFKYEEHHILPRILGGTDDKDNLVLLTYREHFRAPTLLALMHQDVSNLPLGYNEDAYEKNREQAARLIAHVHKGRKKSEGEVENIRRARLTAKPRVFSEEARANMAAARRKTWEERRANGTDKLIAEKVLAKRRENGTYAMSEERCKQISERQKGRVPWNKGKKGVLSEESRSKMRESRKAYFAREFVKQ